MSYQSMLTSLALGLSLVFTTNLAFAVVEEIDPFEGVECLGGGEQAFCVQEIFGQYKVTNNDVASIFAFGVTNTATSPTYSSRDGWNSYSLTEEEWNTAPVTAYFNDEWVPLSELGAYSALFGSDAAVNFYYASDTGLSIAQNETDDGFFFNLAPGSEATAFGANGNVLFTTVPSVAAVPEPETYAMLLAGLAMLGLAKRRYSV